MPTQPLRLILLIACFACYAASATAAPVAEPPLNLDTNLHHKDTGAPLPLIDFDQIDTDAPLNLSASLPPERASTPPEALHPVRYQLRSSLRLLWLLSASLLTLHLLYDWLRALRLRVNPPERECTLDHAAWPSISILIPNHSSSEHVCQQLDGLHTCFFDYPAERIHFVPMFDPADTAVSLAIERLEHAFPDRVHPLPMMAGRNTTLASALHAAIANSMGSALVVLDQSLPLPQAWLRQSLSPLLDPSVGSVLSLISPSQAEHSLSARLNRLSHQADAHLTHQHDALNLLLCGKARVRALRRHAVKHLDNPDLHHTPDGAGIVLALTQQGWQSHLLRDETSNQDAPEPNAVSAPRLHIPLALRSMRMASLLLNPRMPRTARLQAGAAFFSAAMPLLWLLSLLCGISLYFLGEALLAGSAITLCALCSFDPHGQPSAVFKIAATARMAGLRSEVRLLPIACFSFLDQLVAGLITLLRARLESAKHPAATEHPVGESTL